MPADCRGPVRDWKDVIKLGVALIATMSALVLSLLMSSVKTAFDRRSNQLVQAAADIVMLDRALARYGPETKAAPLLQRAVAETVERFWPENGANGKAIPDPILSWRRSVASDKGPTSRKTGAGARHQRDDDFVLLPLRFITI